MHINYTKQWDIPEPNDPGNPINPFNCGAVEGKSRVSLFCWNNDSPREAKGGEPNGEFEFGICIGEEQDVIAKNKAIIMA